MAKKFLTEEGRTRLMAELDDLKTVQRPGIIKRIHEAKEFGELNEGNESDEVRNEQAFIEGRIMMLERLLKDAEVIRTRVHDRGHGRNRPAGRQDFQRIPVGRGPGRVQNWRLSDRSNPARR